MNTALQQYYQGDNIAWQYQPYQQYVTNGYSTTTITFGETVSYSGDRFLVVCNGGVTELPENASFEAATRKAEELAHKHQSEAFVLKPVRKVAPKRDVVVSDL